MSRATGAAAPGPTPEAEELAPEWSRRRSWAARWRSAGIGGSLLAGAVLLLGYLAVGVFAVLHFGLVALGTLPRVLAWETLALPPGPSVGHPFGIMSGVGIDLLSALVRSTPTDLTLVGVVLGGSAVLGWLLGSLAGARERGAVDWALTTASDLLVGVPPFLLAAILFLNVQPYIAPDATTQLAAFALVFVFVLWPFHARPVRARARQVAGEPYVEAARAAGATTPRVLARHILPNSVAPILAQLPADFGNLFFFLTAFPFLNCFGNPIKGNPLFPPVSPFAPPLPPSPPGLPPSVPLPPMVPEWGILFAQGACNGWSPIGASDFWWMYLFPTLAIVGLGVGIALVCDGVAQRYERRARGR